MTDLNQDYEVKCYSGNTRMQSELTKAFNMIAPKDNWKMPICCKVPMDGLDMMLIVDACVHFTSSVPSFKPYLYNWIVTADGYYRTCGS